MARRLRMYEGEGVYFVTARTFQGRFLIQRFKETNEVIGGVLARAAKLWGLEIHGFVVTSNHLHILSTARDGSLSRCMQYVLGNLSKKLGRLAKWKGQFWERRFAAEPVLGPESQERKLRYILSHGVKEGLVRSPKQWPLLNCLGQLLGDASANFRFFRWGKRWHNGQLVEGGENLFDEKWAELEKLEVTPLPAWKHFSPQERQQRVQEMVASIEAEGREKFKTVKGPPQPSQRGKPFQTAPYPQQKKPQPWCHADNVSMLHHYKEKYRLFATWFRQASKRFLKGEFLVEFPPLAFRPFAWPLPPTNYV